jgi:DNA mismatch repair protein MutL
MVFGCRLREPPMSCLYTHPVPALASPARIKPLPTLVANQIAAGEVVERPASVVKELVENSLDAGASRVTLDLEQGGVELIRVTDDGCGILEADLPLALAPHATSKIAVAADLEHVGTLGFRGEALASIASVSRLSIRSRTADQDGASMIDADPGLPDGPAARPAPGPVGTCITVRNLFFNTPARRKFLRTVGTEQERALDIFKQLAMAHPAVAFNATCDGRQVLDLPPNQSPRERAVAIMGKELAPQLLEVHADQFDDSRGVALWGLAGTPAIARGTNRSQHIFVNGRAIRDRAIQHAIAEAYRGLIDPSRYPTAVLMLELSPAGVDVNVHPAKAEVRFRDGSLIHSVVLRAVREALRAADLTPTIAATRAFAPAADPMLPGSGALPPGDPAASVTRFVDYFRRPTQAGPQPLNYAAMTEALKAPQSASGPDVPLPTSNLEAAPQPSVQSPSSLPTPALPQPTPEGHVLQVHNSYLVTQDDQGVVIIDQHALHERVMFEYLLARVTAGGLESQQLLAPSVVPATPAQIDRLAELTPLLDKIGITIAPMGKDSIGIHAFPSFLFDRGVDPIEFMQELLDAPSPPRGGPGRGGGESPAPPSSSDIQHPTSDIGKDITEAALRDVLDMMACKAAVKAGDHMSALELAELVKLRSEVERSSNCPHGRPTSIRLTIRELEKLFGRT